jgi:hypothetical protein
VIERMYSFKVIAGAMAGVGLVMPYLTRDGFLRNCSFTFFATLVGRLYPVPTIAALAGSYTVRLLTY